LFFPILISWLGPDRFGAWSLVSAGVGVLGVLDLGISASLYRYFGVNGEEGRDESGRLLTSALLVLILVALVLAAVGHLLAPEVAAALRTPAGNRPEISAMLSWVGGVLVLPVIVAALGSRLQAASRFGWLVVAVAAGQIVYVAGVLFGHRGGTRLSELLAALALGLTVTIAVEAAAIVGFLGWRPWRSGLIRRSDVKELCGFAWSMQQAGFWAFVNLEADALVVAAFLPLRLVGAYSVGATVASGLRSCVGSLLLPLLPPLSRAGPSTRESLAVAEIVQRQWVRLAARPALIAIPVAALTAWSLGGVNRSDAALVAAVLSFGHAVNLGTAVLSYWTRVVSRPDIEARYGRVSALINVAVTVALTPWLGLAGVCIGTAAGQLCGSLWFVRTLSRWVSGPVRSFVADVPWRAAVPSSLAVCAAAAVLLMFDAGRVVALVAMAVVGLVAWRLPTHREDEPEIRGGHAVASSAASNIE
jgi:O-antigen/teichoic acid export membrane protein